MCHHFNLHPHIIFTKSRNPHAGPDRLMIRHPFLKVPSHGSEGFVVERNMVRVDSKHLAPSLATGVLEVVIDSFEGLVDLLVDFGGDLGHLALRAPSAWYRSAFVNIRGQCHFELTLSRTVDAISNSDSLAIRELFSIAGANTGIAVILEVRHLAELQKLNEEESLESCLTVY